MGPRLDAIRADGRPSESFYFRFQGSHRDLYLFLKPLYMTWQPWPLERSGSWCRCEDPAEDG